MKIKKYIYKIPRVNGMWISLPLGKLDEALKLMSQNDLEPEEVDLYLVSEWN